MNTRWLTGLSLFGIFGACAKMDQATDSTADAAAAVMRDSGGDAAPAGDMPGVTADTVLHVHYPLKSGSSLSVRGSVAPFNWTSGMAMTKKSDTLYELRIKGLKSALEWKPLVGDSTWSRGNNFRASPGQTVEIYPHFYTGSGRYERHYTAFHSTVLGNDRGVWIYLPPSFDENPQATYPVLYMHDGQNLFDPRYAYGGRTWQVAQTLDGGIDALDDSLHLPELVVVAPENTDQRIPEYTPTPDPDYPEGGRGDLYLRFLHDELKPAIESDALLKGRLLTDLAHTGLAGSSLGGLITAYAGLKQPDVYSHLGIFSPSTWWDSDYIVTAVAGAGGITPRWTKVYVDSGQPDDSYPDTLQLVQKYRALGYHDDVDLKYVVAPGALHNEDAWAARLPAALRFLCADW